jgi:hypothetical protein
VFVAVSLLSRCSPRHMTSSSCGKLHTVYMDRAAYFSSYDECDVDLLGTDSLYSQFLISFRLQLGWFAVSVKQWLDHCPFTTTAVSSAKVASSAVYSRYNNDPRTLPLGTPAMTEECPVYSVSAFTRKSAM